MIEKGTWVLIHRKILSPEERAPQIPEDTKKVPLEMWIKGYLAEDGKIGDEVKVKTRTGRIETGTLVEAEPYYKHDYGRFVPELLAISEQARKITFGGEE
jgi:hypothetical protein